MRTLFLMTVGVVALGAASTASHARAAGPEKLDCHGGNITITGEHRTVELTNCAVVRITGNHNNVSGRLAQHAKVLVTGEGNEVSLGPPNGVSFSHIKDTGKDNKVNGPG